MHERSLPGTGITTSALGFGCAGLHRLAHAGDRQAVLHAAFAAGVRHFDTAPMYGLGRAEAELAKLLRANRDEVTVTTKFGIEASALGRAAGRVQGPARAVLARRLGLQSSAVASGSGPSSGALGRLLYDAPGYDAGTAARSLHRSLRTLRTDHIDVFALHDPMGAPIRDPATLIRYLDDQVRAGTIGCWGIAGELPSRESAADRLLAHAGVVQHHDDVFDDVAPIRADQAAITFGSRSRALPRLLGHLAVTPKARQRWSDQLGTNVADPDSLAGVLLREALRRNPNGIVLFTTTRPPRVQSAVAALAGPDDPAESAALRAIVDEVANGRREGRM